MLSWRTFPAWLKPSWRRLAITGVFVAIAYGGYAQSWALSGKALGLPPPALVALFKPIPFLWELWVLLISPLVIPLHLVGAGDFVATELRLLWGLQIPYFYLLASLLTLGLDQFSRQRVLRGSLGRYSVNHENTPERLDVAE